jgi:ACS family glucarate transporter-like MFS transporter
MGKNNRETPDASPGNRRPGQAKPTRVRFRVLALGCSLALLTYIHRQAFVRAMPEIKNDLDLNTEQMGYLAAAFLVAYGLFQVPCGLIGDRLGARHLLTFLVLGWSLLTGVASLAGVAPTGVGWQFLFLLSLRFLFGIFQAGGFPVWARVMADWIPVSERGSGQGTVWMFSRVGGALSPFLFLWLFQYFGTWRTPLWVLAGLGLVWCAVFWPWFRNRPEDMPQVNAAERELIASGRAASAAQRGPVPWRKLLSSVSVWSLCLMYGFVGFSGNFITNLLPLYLADNRKLTPETTTWLAGLPLAFGVVSCVLGGFLSDFVSRRWGSRKWGRRLNASAGLALAGLALLAVPWVEAVWLLALLLSASFFFNDLSIGPAWAACADVGEHYAGTISGAMNMIGQFAGAAGMALAGAMLQRGHSELLFIVFAGSYALAAACWFGVDVTKPISSGPDPASSIGKPALTPVR